MKRLVNQYIVPESFRVEYRECYGAECPKTIGIIELTADEMGQAAKYAMDRNRSIMAASIIRSTKMLDGKPACVSEGDVWIPSPELVDLLESGGQRLFQFFMAAYEDCNIIGKAAVQDFLSKKTVTFAD